ncbi:short-chain collagen C4-like [Saccostrea cucullata]|uniref:short-chain collagen C4-like n=1 Tax=Saccostrea cuccullata TaxID=36930 RepID=UPI002ED4913C
MLTFRITYIIVVIGWHQVGIRALNDVSEEDKTRDKRILLNDPSLFDQRLQQMDHKIQSMTSEIQSLTSELHQTTQNLRDVTSKLHQAEAAISKLTSSSTGKPTYVRWGKHGCGANATLIYTGQVGGSAYSQTGGAANPLCMVHDVIWGSNKPEGFMAEIRGAEYQDHFWGTGSLDKDVPCAVCSPINDASLLMIPGRNRCLPGWKEQYHGYLSANAVSHAHTTTYICVDENVEFMDAGSENDEHSFLMYGVRTHCGSLKCPPYENGKPITCVVCSK